MNVGERIKRKRQQLNMFAEELAERIGKNRATVYRYENGEVSPPIDVLEKIANELKVPIEDLVSKTKQSNVEQKQTMKTEKEVKEKIDIEKKRAEACRKKYIEGSISIGEFHRETIDSTTTIYTLEWVLGGVKMINKYSFQIVGISFITAGITMFLFSVILK